MDDVTSRVTGARECCTGYVLETPYMKYPPHVWIYYNGKHYDAECPTGVSDFKLLPFFKNCGIEIADEDILTNDFTE